ncbi:hypothetical protein [Streptomyces fructofermentans]|uniref:Secreted protein n=1 Tax=Streptomyces fructofermentans TaxID=152141 RepID=A0A918K8W7_9ACTN|nr:hypothetical protein [Streptomyces fructofermentans]GGX53281.1 hypothetical protein GCM10010515_20850 [Streptomyces fructofermentans]
MRRTVRALSATALTAVALGVTAGVAVANPSAEVTPRIVAPGGTVTVSVLCEPSGGTPPDTIEAESKAFEHGAVQLRRAKGEEDTAGGPVYSGTARIAPAADFEAGGPDSAGRTSEWTVDGACPVAPGAQGKPWSASFTVTREHSRGTGVQHGVRAGEGGAFNDSTVALVTGGVLIAGALGAAVHRLRRREQ